MRALALGLVLAAVASGQPRLVDSREFQLPLDAGAFGAAPGDAVSRLAAEVVAAAEAALGRPVGDPEDLADPKKPRTVRFLDSPGTCALHAGGYRLRERVSRKGKRRLTLKYRSADRYDAAGAPAAAAPEAAAARGDPEEKFEEDRGPGRAVFSRSVTVRLHADAALARVADALALFPGLEELELDPATPLATVGGRRYQELRYGDLDFELGGEPAELSVTLWVPEGGEVPAVAELSFRVEAEAEGFGRPGAREAARLFEALQGLKGWVGPRGGTKTGAAYAAEPCFCGCP